jgi:hypothetical protein
VQSARSQIAGVDLPSIWQADALERRPYLISYRRRPLVLAELEARVGEAVFLTIMQRYMAEKVSTTAQLIEIVAQQTTAQTASWFQDALGKEQKASEYEHSGAEN